MTTALNDLKATLRQAFDTSVTQRENASGYTLSPAHLIALREFIDTGVGTLDDLWRFAHVLCLGALPEHDFLAERPIHEKGANPQWRFARRIVGLVPTEKADAFASFRASFASPTRRT